MERPGGATNEWCLAAGSASWMHKLVTGCGDRREPLFVDLHAAIQVG